MRTAFLSVWQWLPRDLKRFLALVVGVAFVMVTVIWSILGFPILRDYVKDKLGIQQDLQDVQQGLSVRSDEEMNRAIEFTARAIVNTALDSLSNANDSLFGEISKELIEPGIDKLNNVEAQVKRLNEKLGLGNDLLKQQATAQRETNDRIGNLQQQLSGTDQDQKLNAILQQLQTMAAEQEEIRNRLNKTTKQKF